MNLGGDEPIDSFDQVRDVLEAAGLLAVAVDGERLAHERLIHEVREHAAIVEPHPLAVRVEDADDVRVHAVDAVVRHRHGFGESLGLVVDAADADRVDVAPVAFGLRMLQRVAVNFAGAGEQEAGVVVLGEAERVVGAERTDLQGLNREFEVIDGARRAREMEHVVDLVAKFQRVRDVVADELELRIRAKRVEVFEAAGEQVIDGDDLVPFGQEAFAEVRADEPGPSGNERAHGRHPFSRTKNRVVLA